MCFKHEAFREILSSAWFTDMLSAIIIDECHVVESWGTNFRSDYSLLGQLRAFVPIGIPILATSATMTPKARDTIAKVLDMDLEESFYLNLGNDRPNITYRTMHVKSAEDFDALESLFSGTYRTPDDIKQTFVYIDNRLSTQIMCNRIRSWLPAEFWDCVCYFHAGRSKRTKRRIMREFQEGKRRIAVATDAAGIVRTITSSLILF